MASGYFYWRLRAPRVQRSFPTRRSSDLAVQRADHAAVGEAVELGADAPAAAGARVLRFARDEGDRKSTRLNSSHITISYAVFCLKQKKAPCQHRAAAGC